MVKTNSISNLGILTYSLGIILLIFSSPKINLSPGQTNPSPDYLLIGSLVFLIIAAIILISALFKKNATKNIRKNKKRN